MDKLLETIAGIGKLDEEAMAAARARQDTLTKPAGSLGRLEELSVQLAGIQGRPLPGVEKKSIITMAGDHGVVAEGVGNWPQEITAQMVANFLAGGAGINVLARQVGAQVIVVDMGVAGELAAGPGLLSRKIGRSTANMAQGPAMSVEDAVRCLETGIDIIIEAAKSGLDIVGTGDMGIGNTTLSSAVTAVMTGHTVVEVTDRGTGLSDQQLRHKISVIEKAISLNKPDSVKPLEVLATVGGFEIGGLAGVIIGAASMRIPVVIDGFISGAAALIATALAPSARDYLIASHLSVEGGHAHVLRHLGLQPLLDLKMRLGEGTGAALGIFLADSACRILSEMATFAEAGVSEKEEDAKA